MTTLSQFASAFIGTKQNSVAHKRLIDVYNQIVPLPRGYKVKYSDSWCMTFVSICQLGANVKKPVLECSCFYALREAQKKRLVIKTSEAKVDDIIFYNWNNDNKVDHVGIISQVDNKYFYVIEGNYSKQVKVRKILKKDKQIECVIRVN